MATRLSRHLRSGKNVSSVPAKMKGNRRALCKVPKSSFHPSIPRKPLALPWRLDDTENEPSTYQNEDHEEMEWSNKETFGGSNLHFLGEYMLPKPLEGLEQVEKLSQLRFHHLEEAREHFLLGE